jgi:hypothetical protein
MWQEVTVHTLYCTSAYVFNLLTYAFWCICLVVLAIVLIHLTARARCL